MARLIPHIILLLVALLTSNIVRAATQERPDADMSASLIAAINSSDSFVDRFDAEVWLTDMSNRLQSRVEDPD